MLGDHPHPFLFVHIPKTAGTSVENALIPTVCGRENLKALTTEDLTRHALPGGVRHQTGRQYRSNNGVVQHECVEYFEDMGLLAGREVVTVVRNPYDRALSEIFYLLHTYPKADEVFRGPSWADDLKAYAAYDGWMAHDLGACQVDWLTDSRGRMRCDRMLRFENLSEDWSRMCEEWGIGPIPLPHVHNMGRQVPWWEYYDDEAAAAIANKYARDFDMLGYDTTLPRIDPESAAKRILWLGHGPPPAADMLVAGQRTWFKRFELPEGAVGRVCCHGTLERLTLADGIRLLRNVRGFLGPEGELSVRTLDYRFLSSLAEAGYVEDSPQARFVCGFVERFLPAGTPMSPALVASRILLGRGLLTVYDVELLHHALEEAGLEGKTQSGAPLGEIHLRARAAFSHRMQVAVASAFPDVTVVIKTLIRYGVLGETIESFRRIDPGIRIIVVDDTPPEMLRMVSGVEHVVTEPDIGVCAGRNLGFRRTVTPIVLYTDDDTPCLMSGDEFREAVDLVRSGVVEFLGWNGYDIIETPGNNPLMRGIHLERLTEVEATDNAYIAHRDFLLAHPYDERIKIGGEHFSYFLKLKRCGVRIHTAPFVKFRNLAVRNDAYEKYRNRREFRRYAREETGHDSATWLPPPSASHSSSRRSPEDSTALS